MGLKGSEVTGEWRKHGEELTDLYCSPNIFLVTKSRMRWAGNIERKEREEVYSGFWWGNLRGRVHLEIPGVDGKIILKWIFRKLDVGAVTGLIWLRIGTDGGLL